MSCEDVVITSASQRILSGDLRVSVHIRKSSEGVCNVKVVIFINDILVSQKVTTLPQDYSIGTLYVWPQFNEELRRVRVELRNQYGGELLASKTILDLDPGPEPDPDPCEGVICDPTCYGYDKHNTVCSEGVCIKGALIESNASDCGYVPPDPPDPDGRLPPCGRYGDVDGDGYVTQADSEMLAKYLMGGWGVTLTPEQRGRAQVIKSGHISLEGAGLISQYAKGEIDTFPICGTAPTPPTPDPCDGVVCDPTCYGYDRHDTVCSEGVCIKGALIEENASVCGYSPPDPDPDPEPEPEPDEKMNVVYMLIIAFVIYIMFMG